MKIYADTSALIAYFNPEDEFAVTVADWFKENADAFAWNGILRAELRHNLRKIKTGYKSTAWNAYRAVENSSRFFTMRARVDSLLDDLDDLDAQLAQKADAGTMDFFHVAAARRSGCDCFATCDKAQAYLARLAGFSKVKLFKI